LGTDAPFYGEILKNKKVKPDLIMCRPCKKEQKNCDLPIAEKIGVSGKKRFLYNKII